MHGQYTGSIREPSHSLWPCLRYRLQLAAPPGRPKMQSQDHTLLSLPPAILRDHIAISLSARSLVSLERTCRHFSEPLSSSPGSLGIIEESAMLRVRLYSNPTAAERWR